MHRLSLCLLVSLLTACIVHAAPPTVGQYEIRKRTSTGFESYGVTITNGQAFGLAAGIPAAVTVGGGSGTGTVTSVALTLPGIFSVTGSPITESGTLAASLATQTANRVWAGPTTGSAAAPTFRALVANDLPDLSSVYQPIAGILTAFSGLSNATGVLTNNGSGSLSYTATSSGGNKDADSGKLVKFDSVGGVYFSSEVRIYPYPSGSNFLQFNNSRIQWLRGASDYCNIIPSEAGSACTFYFPTNPGTHTLALEDGNITGTAGGPSSTLAVTSGGTGQTSYTNGQLLIGNTTGNTLTKATLTAGTGITITNGAGSITIAAAPPLSSITGLGTGIATALAINTGSVGSPVLYNGNAGTPSAINLSNGTALPLASGVSGALPLADLAQASAASKLLGRGASSGAGDYQEITLGSGLTMTGTTLSSSGGLSAPTLAGINSITSATGQTLTLAADNYAGAPGVTIIGGDSTDGTSGLLRVKNQFLSTVFSINWAGEVFCDRINPSSVQLTGSGGIARASYASFPIYNPVLKWPDNSADVGLDRAAAGILKVTNGSTGGGVLAFPQTSTPTPPSSSAIIYSKDVSGTAEAFVMDAAGNETQISPHNTQAPESLVDSAFDEIGYTANLFTGIVTYTNKQRQIAGRSDAQFFETFEEHNERLNLQGKDRLVISDWDQNQARFAAESQALHDSWLERKSTWLALPENAGKAFTEEEPEIIRAKPQPDWLFKQLAGKEAFLAARPAAGVAVSMTSMRLALIDAQLLQPVINVLEAIPDPVKKLKAKTWWETAQNVTRNHPLVLSLASALGQSPEQVDALFPIREAQRRRSLIFPIFFTPHHPHPPHLIYAHPLVIAVAAALNLNLDEVWDGILAIE